MALSNTQYDEIIRQYNAKQIRNRHIVESRVEEVYSKNPRLQEIDDSISSCSVEKAKQLLDGDVKALSELKEQIASLKEEKTALLLSLGYDEHYFIPPYDCPDCKDTGYVGNKRCHCFKQAAIDLVYTQSNIKAILQVENFEHFSYDYFSEELIDPSTGLSSRAIIEDAVKESQRFINSFDDTFPESFLLWRHRCRKDFPFQLYCKRAIRHGTFRYLLYCIWII